MNGDEIMQGLIIALFSLCGVSAVVQCIRLRMRNRLTMKQSPSMEDLNSIDNTDPEQNV